MILPTKDGITCDRCGRILKDQFEYYSDKRTRVQVDRSRSKTGVVEVDEDILDFDICTTCHQKDIDDLKRIMENQK